MKVIILVVLCFALSGCCFLYPQYANQKANNEQVKQLSRIADALERVISDQEKINASLLRGY